MKTGKVILAALLAAQLLAACSDGEIQMTTLINRNGSCQRMVTFAADSAALVGGYDTSAPMAHLLSDSAWDKTWCIKDDTARHPYPMTPEQYSEVRASLPKDCPSDTLRICAARNFASVEEMGGTTLLMLGDKPLMAQVSLKKRFRWFYTDYVFEETYPVQSQFFSYPLNKFVEDDVASYWFTGEPDLMQGHSPAEKKETDDMIEEQCDRWLVANYVAEAFDAVADGYDSLSDMPMTKSAYLTYRDSLIDYALDCQFTFGDNIDTLFSGYFHSQAYEKAFASSKIEQQLDAKLDDFVDLMGLKVDYWLVLPGTIRDAGNGVLEQGAVRYRLTGNRLVPHDYTLAATSRATNIWAFVLTALILLAAIVGLKAKAKK